MYCVLIYVCIYEYTYLPSYLPICLSICLSVCLCSCLSVCLSVYVSVCVSVYLSVCLSICLSVCLSIDRSIYPSIYECLCIYTYINIEYDHVCMYVYIYYNMNDLYFASIWYPQGLFAGLWNRWFPHVSTIRAIILLYWWLWAICFRFPHHRGISLAGIQWDHRGTMIWITTSETLV